VLDDNPPSQKHNGWHCCDLQPQGPRSRAFYYSRNSLLHTQITLYTELPMKVTITPHRLENRYYAPPPIAITGNRLTPHNAHPHKCTPTQMHTHTNAHPHKHILLDGQAQNPGRLPFANAFPVTTAKPAGYMSSQAWPQIQNPTNGQKGLGPSGSLQNIAVSHHHLNSSRVNDGSQWQ